MEHAAIIGAQWGDEGKGKISDFVSSAYDVSCRFNGGDNAAHTVIHDGKQIKFRMLPAASLNSKIILLSAHVVIDPTLLFAEIEQLKDIIGEFQLIIDHRAHLVLPYHREFDAFYETWRGNLPIRSTKRGIGPCNADRTDRLGIRMGELLDLHKLKLKVSQIFPLKERILNYAFDAPTSLTQEYVNSELTSFNTKLSSYIGDANAFFAAHRKNLSFLFEGAQGTLLDNSYGIYPFVAGYSTISSAIFPSFGVHPFPLRLIGVTSSYTTQVGNSPFPTEQDNEIGQLLQLRGKEISVIGPRRCGWLDLIMLKYSIAINGFSELALTKIDVLDEFDSILVCIGYELNHKTIEWFPSNISDLEKCKPIYKAFPGWRCSTRSLQNYSELPMQAKRFIEFIETFVNVPIRIISTGPERGDTIVRS